MAKIAIVTDSTAYLPDDYIEANQVTVVPLSVSIGNETRREGVEIKTREFYQILSGLKELPKTSQPAVGELVQVFQKLLQSHDSVIGMFLSSGFSGTFQTAQAAAGMAEGDVAVIDSRLTSYNLGSMVKEAVALRDAGKSKEEIISRIQHIVANQNAYFIVDSLDHLHKGGRISGAAALVGSLLQVKPVLYVTADGRLDVMDKVRTRRKALDRVVELFKEDRAKHAGQPVHLGVVFSDNLDDARQFQERLRDEFPGMDPELSELGPVIGTHVGPGVLAIIYYFG